MAALGKVVTLYLYGKNEELANCNIFAVSAESLDTTWTISSTSGLGDSIKAMSRFATAGELGKLGQDRSRSLSSTFSVIYNYLQRNYRGFSYLYSSSRL
jgi:hypothetical protein